MTAAEILDAEQTGDWRSLVRAALRSAGGNDLRRAERLLAAAWRLRPRQPEVLLALGRLRSRQGLLGDAERYLREAWDLGGKPVAAAALARLVARERGRPSEALVLLADAAARSPRSALVECVRGEVLLDGGNLPGARRSFERALSLDRGCRAARFGLARALVAEAIAWLDRGEPTRGLFLLRRATGLDGAWSLPHRAMAVAFEAIGCESLAAKSRCRAAELD